MLPVCELWSLRTRRRLGTSVLGAWLAAGCATTPEAAPPEARVSAETLATASGDANAATSASPMLASGTSLSTASDATPVASDASALAPAWRGFARLASEGAFAPAELALASAHAQGGAPYRAMLRLSFAGPHGAELTTLYFAKVDVAARDDGSLHVTAKNGAERLTGTLDRDGHLELQVALDAATNGPSRMRGGELALTLAPVSDTSAAAPAPPGPLAFGASGAFEGQCGEGAAGWRRMEIEASRWSGGAPGDGLLAGFRLAGRLATRDPAACGHPSPCVASTADAVWFDPLASEMRWQGATPETSFTCKISAKDAQCSDGCTLARVAATHDDGGDADTTVTRFPRRFHVAASEPATAAHKRGPRAAGQYYGYLHHEATDAYQLVALQLGAARADAPLPAIATLYFGDGDSSEFVAFRLTGTPGENVLDGPGEAFLVVEDWRRDPLVAVWYAKTFGRVGTVELARDLVPALAAEAHRVEGLGGRYADEGWELELAASSAFSTETHDFYPLKVFGSARERLPHARPRTVVGGAFDYRTGELAIALDDGRALTGLVAPGQIALRWPPKSRPGTPLAPEAPRRMQRQNDAGSARASLERAPRT